MCRLGVPPFKETPILGCPRKLGSMVSKWVISPTYKMRFVGLYPTDVLTFDPNVQRDILTYPPKMTITSTENDRGQSDSFKIEVLGTGGLMERVASCNGYHAKDCWAPKTTSEVARWRCGLSYKMCKTSPSIETDSDSDHMLQTQLGQSIFLRPDGFPSIFFYCFRFTQAFIGSTPEALKGKIRSWPGVRWSLWIFRNPSSRSNRNWGLLMV